MVDEMTIGCIMESEADTVEIALRKRMEDLLSEGRIDEADHVENLIKKVDKIPICGSKEEKEAKGFAMMMRDRARNL